MKTTLKWIGFGVLTFLAFLVATVPAHLAIHQLPQQIKISGIDGTLWNGRAAHLQIQDFALGEVQWNFKPLHLLLGRIAAEVQFDRPDLQGQGNLIVKLNGIGIENVDIKGDSTLLDTYLSSFGTSVSGEIDLKIQSLHINNIGPQAADGHLIWRNASILTPSTLTLGDVECNLEQLNDAAVVNLKNNGNAITLSGSAELKPNWDYATNIRLEPTSITPRQVKQALLLFGRSDSKGAVTLQQSGRLPLFDSLPTF